MMVSLSHSQSSPDRFSHPLEKLFFITVIPDRALKFKAILGFRREEGEEGLMLTKNNSSSSTSTTTTVLGCNKNFMTVAERFVKFYLEARPGCVERSSNTADEETANDISSWDVLFILESNTEATEDFFTSLEFELI
jgi:hypothetical protein